jgi:hypothetical protein
MIFGEKFISAEVESAKFTFGENGIGKIRLRRKWTNSIQYPNPNPNSLGSVHV